MSYHEVREACAQAGCPLCRLATEAVDRYLDAILYEDVNDPEMRAKLSASQGYCHTHAWRLTAQGGSALGIAIVYQDLVRQAARRLAGARLEPGGLLRRAGTGAAVRALTPEARCPACAHRDEMERLSLTTLVEALAQRDKAMQAALEGSAGLCLPHLRRALEVTQDEAGFAFLRGLMEAKLKALAAELDEFIRKNDYRFSHEGFGAEGDSWQRAIGVVVGERQGP
jgi:hypothetical protein